MPVELLRSFGVVMDVDDNAFSLSEAKQWAGKTAVIGFGRNCRLRPKLYQAGSDTDSVAAVPGLSAAWCRWLRRMGRHFCPRKIVHAGSQGCSSGQFEHATATEHHGYFPDLRGGSTKRKR